MSGIESLRSFVNTWECDENAHLNVQFYFGHFEAASSQFLAIGGLETRDIGDCAVRHVRYHSEMRSSEMIVVRSAVVRDGPHRLSIAHQMFDPVSGRLTATALDGYPDAPEGLTDGLAGTIETDPMFLPRSLPAAPATIPEDTAFLSDPSKTTFRGVVQPRDCDAGGQMFDRSTIGYLSDGAAHSWAIAALDNQWFEERNYGRVAVEMKLTSFERFRAGDLITNVTLVRNAGAKTIEFHHHLIDSRTGRIGAICEVTALVVDLERRKAVDLPDRVRETVT